MAILGYYLSRRAGGRREWVASSAAKWLQEATRAFNGD